MKRFRFRLQSLLTLERHRVHNARLELARALKALADLDARRDLVHRRMTEATDRYREAIVGGTVDPHEVEGRQRVLARLQAQLIAVEEERGGALATVTACRQELATVRAKEQLLNRRRDEARAIWRSEVDRAEADLIDEFLSGRDARPQPGVKS